MPPRRSANNQLTHMDDSMQHSVTLSRQDILCLLQRPVASLLKQARSLRNGIFGHKVIIRGIVEFSNHCVRDCRYCGLRKSNSHIKRYRLGMRDILQAVSSMQAQGVQTVVLQSGDDFFYTQDMLCRTIAAIKQRHPGMAVTLSIGERSYSDLHAFRCAGADRYLLKHETIDKSLYTRLHPGQSLSKRLDLLCRLRELGYQVGTGVITGLPGQTMEHLAQDLLFMQDFQPDMCSIGSFVPQAQTPLAEQAPGRTDTALRVLAITRLITGNAHLPVTTALASMLKRGYPAGLEAGANVIMLVYTPEAERALYTIYNGKGSREYSLNDLKQDMSRAGYSLSLTRGDSLKPFATKSACAAGV